MNVTAKIKSFIDADNQRLEKLIEEYPLTIPVPVASDFLGCHQDTLLALSFLQVTLFAGISA